VIWLCPRHHGQRHRELRASEGSASTLPGATDQTTNLAGGTGIAPDAAGTFLTAEIA
jgi:hypothetical protein